MARPIRQFLSEPWVLRVNSGSSAVQWALITKDVHKCEGQLSTGWPHGDKPSRPVPLQNGRNAAATRRV